jgi:hypothetical protein
LYTSDSDAVITFSDTWAISRQNGDLSNAPGTGFYPDDYAAFSFGETLDYFYNIGEYVVWGKFSVPFETGETKSLLMILGGLPNGDPVSELRNRAIALLTDGASLYDYTYAGNRLLGHLSYAQLQSVVNWNLISGGAGGDPHGRHFDGSLFEFPRIRNVYCLYHDRKLQVNIEVGASSFITEVVAFSRSEGWTINARLNDEGHPEYRLNDELVEIPASLFDGKIKTFLGAFPHGKTNPLSELERYHENMFVFRNYMTIVGGYHPRVSLTWFFFQKKLQVD